MNTNPEIKQDRVADTVEHFKKFGYIMFPQQERIYNRIADECGYETILEAGCGNGIGSGILSQQHTVTATDKLKSNIEFAKCLYPWIEFGIWDLVEYPGIISSIRLLSESVVAVEVIEHVEFPEIAITHLIEAAAKEVWISTPNGTDKPRPPENPFHVCEYTPQEVLDMIYSNGVNASQVRIIDWKTWETVDQNTLCDPLVYHIRL